MILALDISTTCTGVCLINEKGELVRTEYIKTNRKKHEDLFDKADEVSNVLYDMFEEFVIKSIWIESSLKSFAGQSKGTMKSSPQTLANLNKMNAMVSLICYQLFEMKPNFIESRSARAKCKIKAPKGTKGKDLKQFVLDKIKLTYPSFRVDYTRTGTVSPTNFDRADAVVIGRAGWLIENERGKTSTS